MSKEELLDQWVNDTHRMMKDALVGYYITDVTCITVDGRPDSDIEAVKIELTTNEGDQKTITFMAGDTVINFMINPADPDGLIMEHVTSHAN